MKDLLFPVGRNAGIGLVPVPDNPGDPAAKVLLVEAEGLLAVPAIVYIDIQSQ
jgi:hypothetical protein